MITNERQYKITRAQAVRFEEALAASSAGPHQGTDLRLVTAEREALASQLRDLREELEEYDRWKATDLSTITVSSFDELALGLIRARIASGLTQKDLAERLDIKEQQIQKYESEHYSSASYQRLRDVANALEIRIRNDILLPIAPASLNDLVAKLRQVGLDNDFLMRRLMSPADMALANGEVPLIDVDSMLARIASILRRIFGWDLPSIFGPQPLAAPELKASHARFKMPMYCSETKVRTYVTYAYYLSNVIACGSSSLPRLSHSDNPQRLRSEILNRYDKISLKNLLEFTWDLGIPVLPLRDSGNFHGACWRFQGRNVIILKQRSSSESRWMFDLLHELYHAAQQPHESSLSIIEAPETSAERRNSPEEVSASRFAADVILNGSADDLAQQCASLAGGRVERLKEAVSRISAENAIDVGTLANYLAFRLSWQGLDWWGAAQNLQKTSVDPWRIAHDVFFDRFPFALEDEVDRGLLRRALRGTEND